MDYLNYQTKHFFLTSTLAVIMLVLSGMIMSGCDNNKKSSSLKLAKVYVANEEGGSVLEYTLQIVELILFQ